MTTANTVFLRLDGPLQAWGLTSRFAVRDTADVPTKSGVLGLICAALGLRRGAANDRLTSLAALRMGVRIDRSGERLSDYHTAGAGIGMMAAKGEIKFIPGTKEYEPVLMRKEYLMDAAFLVALQGDPDLLKKVADALQDPVWPPFLGRKSCPPSAPVFAATDTFDDLIAALRSRRFQPRLDCIDSMPNPLTAIVEVTPSGGCVPPDAWLVQDVPISFTHRVYGTRFVRPVELAGVEVGEQEFTELPEPNRRPATTWPGWKGPNGRQQQRLAKDHGLCVFCKEPARDVHHRTYERAGAENIDKDLRSVCKLCHDAMTLLEYAGGMSRTRIDPCDPLYRDAILAQRNNILTHRDRLRRNRALRAEED